MTETNIDLLNIDIDNDVQYDLSSLGSSSTI